MTPALRSPATSGPLGSVSLCRCRSEGARSPSAPAARHPERLDPLDRWERSLQAREAALQKGLAHLRALQEGTYAFLRGNDGEARLCVPKDVLLQASDSFLGGMARGDVPCSKNDRGEVDVRLDFPLKAIQTVVNHLEDNQPYSSDELAQTSALRDYLALDCQGTLELADGSRYQGSLRGEKPHGAGTLGYPDGRQYRGSFEWGQRNGQGTYTLPDGQKYVGEFRDGQKNGQGAFTWPDGEKYVGEYRDDQANGQGTYTWSDGQKYVGEFRDNQRNGQGTHTWSDGQKYVGEFRDNQRNGQGTHTWPNGQKYVGEFRDDQPTGQGIYT